MDFGLLFALVTLGAAGVAQASSDGAPGGCSTGPILPKALHRQSYSESRFTLSISAGAGNAYTISIDQAGATDKINGLRLRPINSPGSFTQNFNTTLFGDVNNGTDCVHHLMKLENELGDNFDFEFVSTGPPGQPPLIEYYIVAGSSADFWTGNIIVPSG